MKHKRPTTKYPNSEFEIDVYNIICIQNYLLPQQILWIHSNSMYPVGKKQMGTVLESERKFDL